MGQWARPDTGGLLDEEERLLNGLEGTVISSFNDSSGMQLIIVRIACVGDVFFKPVHLLPASLGGHPLL